MSKTKPLCHWRRLWRHDQSNSDQVIEQLERGLPQYESSTSESFTKLSSELSDRPDTLSFIEKFHRFAGLDAFQARDVLQFYLSDRFHGATNHSLPSIPTDELLREVWAFYNSERIFMLRKLRTTIEFESEGRQPDLEKLKSSLIDQFESVVNELPPSKEKNGDYITFEIQKAWTKRNLNEQLELLTTIFIIIDSTLISVEQFKKLFSVFKNHNYGRRPNFYKYLDETNAGAVQKIVYIEVAIFYKMIENSKNEFAAALVKSIKDEVESELGRLQYNDEHGSFLLAWMLLLLEADKNMNEEVFFNRCQPFGTKALQLGVFKFLHEMTKHSMFSNNNKCGTIFRNSVYHHLCSMCNRFDADGSMATHPYLIELCSELLSGSTLAKDFWNCLSQQDNQGIVSIWNTALEFFPFDFKSLSLLASGLAKASLSSYQNLMQQLANLPMFSIRYKPRMVTISNVGDEENVVIMDNFYPYNDKKFVIKTKSQAAILDRRNTTIIHFRINVSYWNVLYNEIHHFIENSYQYSFNIEEEIRRLSFGIQTLNSVLKKNEGTLSNVLAGSSEAVFELFIKFLHMNTPYFPLISENFQLCTSLIPKFTKEIYQRLLHIKLLPYVDNVNLAAEQYANGVTFNSSLVGHFLVNVEQMNGEYDILLSYLDMLMAFFKSNYDDDLARGILLPGLIFMLREVFPLISGWNFKNVEDRHKLYSKCVTYFFNILNIPIDKSSNPVDLLLNKICVYSFLYLVNGATLLNLIAYGEKNIQTLMEEETDWQNGPGINHIKTIQLSMSVLMQVLRLKHFVKENSNLTPLEHLIYTQPRQKDTLKIVPIVTNYMNHIFNKNLPNTACSLLKRFALESHMSLLVCLDMSPHQIRTMFLEQLRDETKSDVLKTTILDFVATCVEKQPGLTEVFFKVAHDSNEIKIFKKEESKEKTDGILTYMAEYLSAVKDNSTSLYNPLLSRIMNLFHALWKKNMQMLVDDLKKNSNFWDYLCSPLFHEILPDIKAYSQIFNMIGIELFLCEGKVHENLKKALEKLFNHENKYLISWIQHIFEFKDRGLEPETIDETPNWLSLLASWKNFISIFTKCAPIKITAENKYSMSHSCLRALNRELNHAADSRAIIILAELYAIYFSNWKLECIDDWQEFFRQITILVTNTCSSFETLHHRARYAILAICTLSLNIYSFDLRPEKDLSHKLFYSICHINNMQLDKSHANGNGDCSDAEKIDQDSVMMGLKLLEQAIYIFKDTFLSSEQPYPSTDLVNKLVVCIADAIHKPDRTAETTAALNCLTAFARNNASKLILHCNLSQNLWLKFLPPRELLNANETSSWQPNKWWMIYKCGIDMVTAILQKQGYFFSTDAILFAGIQEEYLIESILLIRQTLDSDALNLTHSALYFLTELIKYQAKWKNEHSQSLFNVVRSVSMCLHYCITLILRPRSVCLLIETPPTISTMEETENAGPSPKVVAVLNKLLELMHLSAITLRAVSPNLLDLLTDPCIELSHWQPLMELQFGSPKLSADPFPPLTFGTVMSGVCLLARSLNYNYHAEDIPLNIIKKYSGRKTSSRRRVSGGLGTEEGIRRRSYRSDSVTSVSSTTSTTVINSNWLAALDKKLVLCALENILTLLASQALLAVKDPRMATKDKQVVRRELCAELPIFHDFVKKKIIESSNPKNYLSRRKHGLYPLLSADEENRDLTGQSTSMEETTEEGDGLFTPPPLPRKRVSDSMRVSVVRKLHLDKTKHTEKDPLPKDADSPSTSKSSGRSTKHVTWDEYSLSAQEELLSTEETEYCILSEVQMVEEDYLHFLSNVFLYICQTDH